VKNFLKNLALVFFSTLLGLFLFEVFLRFFFPQFLNFSTLDPDILGRGKPYGYTLHRTKDYRVKIQLNSKGLRDYEHAYENRRNHFRIVTLGDSFTFGHGVEMEEAFPKVLEKNLNQRSEKTRFEIINASLAGWGNDQAFMFLKKEAIKYNPNLIILGLFVGNDIIENTNTHIFIVKDGKLLPSPHGFQITPTLKIRSFLSSHLHLYRLLADYRFRLRYQKGLKEGHYPPDVQIFYNRYKEKQEKGLTKTNLILERFLAFSREKDISFFVLVIPTKEQVDNQIYRQWVDRNQFQEDSLDMGLPQRVIGNYLRAKGFLFMDSLSPLKKENQKMNLYFPNDGHWNREGHKIMAKILQEALDQNNLIP